MQLVRAIGQKFLAKLESLRGFKIGIIMDIFQDLGEVPVHQN